MQKLPLVSFIIATYRQEQFIEAALTAALRQDYPGDMEILVSDDASPDNTYEVIQHTLRHTQSHSNRFIINTFQQKKNLGIGGNVAFLHSKCKGDIIIGAGGDDISLPHRVSAVVDTFLRYPDLLIVDSNYSFLCDTTVIEHKDSEQFTRLMPYLRGKAGLSGCTRAIRKQLIDIYPPISSSCPTEDSILVFRALITEKEEPKALRISDTLVHYRIHDAQVSSAANIRKINRQAIFQQMVSDTRYAAKHHYIALRNYLPLCLYLGRYGIAARLQNNTLWRRIRKH